MTAAVIVIICALVIGLTAGHWFTVEDRFWRLRQRWYYHRSMRQARKHNQEARAYSARQVVPTPEPRVLTPVERQARRKKPRSKRHGRR